MWLLHHSSCKPEHPVSSAPKSRISVLQKSLTQEIQELDQINIFKTELKVLEMPIYGEKFVYGNKELSEKEVRVALTRAEFALWGRQQARRFAEAKKRPKQAIGNKKADEALPPPKEKEIVTLMNDGPPVQAESPVVTQPRAAGQEDEVRRSLYLPSGFLEHLMGQEEFFLHYLRGHYGVSIMVAVPKKRIHIKGPKPNAVACYACVKELLVRWHQRQAGDQ